MKQLSALLVAVLTAAVSGCTSGPGVTPEQAPSAAQPAHAPVSARTRFSRAMACMDELFLRQQAPTRYITAISLPDHTGENLGGGTVSMLISTVSEMNRRSNAFSYLYLPVTFSGAIANTDTGRIDLNYVSQHIQTVLGNDARGFQVPDYLIVASISQIDEAVSARTAGGGINFGSLSGGANTDELVSVISSDFNVARGTDFRVVNGMNSTNSVSVVRSGTGGDLNARFSGIGAYFNASLDHSESAQAAMRNLIQLSTIETLGKLSGVPYQQCLGHAAPGGGSPSKPNETDTAAAALVLDSGRGTQPLYRIGERLTLTVTPSTDLYVNCYYQDGLNNITRVFPNRFDPNPLLRRNQSKRLPTPDAFDIVFEQSSTVEQLMCIGTSGPSPTQLPAELRRLDLQPTGARSLQAIAAAYRRFAPAGMVQRELALRIE